MNIHDAKNKNVLYLAKPGTENKQVKTKESI